MVSSMPDAATVFEPFSPQTSTSALKDLRSRLRSTRWPDAPEDAGWSMGTNVEYLRELVAYWAAGFDWPAQEAALGQLPRFRVPLGGVKIHFVHAKGTVPAGQVLPVLPLILTHGWHDSFWRYAKIIPLLTDPGAHGADPADAFDVVVPDIPGFGYSDRPTGPPLDSIAVAGLWAELMSVLGYQRFGAAGGDIGSHVSRFLALDNPDRVVAVHRTYAGVPIFAGNPADLAPEERADRGRREVGGGRRCVRRRAPHEATDRRRRAHRLAGRACLVDRRETPGMEFLRRQIERSYTKDEILTNITIYWLTETIGSSMRMYRANAAIPPAQHARRVEVPSGFSLFPGDLLRPRGRGWSGWRTPCGSPNPPAAATSRRSRNPNCTRKSCAHSCGRTGRPRRADGDQW